MREKGSRLGVLAVPRFINHARQVWAVDASPAGKPAAREPLDDFAGSPYVNLTAGSVRQNHRAPLVISSISLDIQNLVTDKTLGVNDGHQPSQS
jgi:hypothetical protein